MSELLSITDPAEDAALIAARAYHQSREHGGYGTALARALTALNLGHLVQGAGYPVRLDAEALSAWLAGKVEGVTVTSREPSNYTVGEAVYRKVSSNLSTRLYEAIERGEIAWTIEETASAFNPDELCRKYGTTGALPRPEGPQMQAIRDQRRAITREFARQADHDGLCSSFEQAIALIGIGRYLPKRDATVTVEVPGFGPVTAEIRLSRDGTIDPGTVRSTILQRVYAKLAESVTVDKVAGLPEGALLAA